MNLAQTYLATVMAMSFVRKVDHTDLAASKGTVTAVLACGLRVNSSWDASRDWMDRDPLSAAEAFVDIRQRIAEKAALTESERSNESHVKNAIFPGSFQEDHGETNPENEHKGGQQVGRIRCEYHGENSRVAITQFYDPKSLGSRGNALDKILDIIQAAK